MATQGRQEKNTFKSLSAGFFGCVIVGSVFESAADGFGVNSSHFCLKYLNMTYNFFFKRKQIKGPHLTCTCYQIPLMAAVEATDLHAYFCTDKVFYKYDGQKGLR